MPSLEYVGIDPTDNASDPKNSRLVVDMIRAQSIMDNLPINRSVAIGQIATKANTYATSSSLSAALLGLAQESYVSGENSKNILKTSLGVPNGIASTGTDNKIPLSQLPSMGNGFVLGPFGYSSAWSGSATTVVNGPFKLAEWGIQTNPITFQPWVFMTVVAQTIGRSVVEIRISNGPTNSYSTSNPLVAVGTGRSFYYDSQPILVMPCASISGQSGTSASSYGPNYNTYLTAWIYDVGGGTSTVSSTSIVSSSAFLVRVTT